MPEETIENPSSIIMEIRAGTGGEEAALFASDLFKMYSSYARSKDWEQKILDSHPTSLGGIKQVTFQIKGDDAWKRLRYEGGVHRVQRTPQTEKGGRIHTSTATVAVLPKPKKKEIEIKPSDIKVDYYRASGPGGQYTNRRETAVRITHKQSGIVVTSQTERNQLENKESAMSILSARLMERKMQEQEEKLSGKRKDQIGSGERAEKIRTYNFPQSRITDHRIKKSWHDLEKIMGGKLDKVTKKLMKLMKK